LSSGVSPFSNIASTGSPGIIFIVKKLINMTVINNVIVYKLFLKIYFINEIYLKNLEYFIYEFLLGDLNNIKNYRLILIDVLKNI
ncbi:MAG: hypothetical protein N3723_02860, partial [Candidatus Phytoplasma australiense]|nr:hypothetical protein [Candidatus Phytoplasma australiense]